MITSSDAAAGSIGATFAACRREGRAALVLYVTAGHPTPAGGLDVLRTIADAGADIIELGVPFSDPLADGPTIQRSSFEAIEQGMTLAGTLELLAAFRAERSTPVVLFSYLNPVLRYGVDAFLRDAERAGANGVLLTDLPAGGDPELERKFADSALDLVRLVSPTSAPARIAEIARGARGFLYYVSRTGVTGASAEMQAGLREEVQAVAAAVDVPVAVGFGVSTPEQAGSVAGFADGVIVGSALVDLLAREGLEAAGEFVRRLREAM